MANCSEFTVYPLKIVIFHSYVSLPEGNNDHLSSEKMVINLSLDSGIPMDTLFQTACHTVAKTTRSGSFGQFANL